MNKTKLFLSFLSIVSIMTTSLYLYLDGIKSLSQNDINIRQSTTSLTGLPGISVYLESPSERHPSLTDSGSVFSTDPFAMDTDFSSIIYKKAGEKR